MNKVSADIYRKTLLEDVIPFWLRHGLDNIHGGLITSLDRDGSVLDTDKSVWFQGRGGWMFATLYNTVDARKEWLAAATSCTDFLRAHCFAPDGKMYFSVTREGLPLRMRRYAYSESFAAIAFAAVARARGDEQSQIDALSCFRSFLHYSFTPGATPPKYEPTRPAKGIGPLMIGIVTAQELRENLGDLVIEGRSCSEWINEFITEIRNDFFKGDLGVLMETVAPDGGILDHLDGRTLNPGHAIECAWFILHEATHRGDSGLIRLGCQILDLMWARGWDEEYGGLFYFRDLYGKPVQEYWQDMKFWWPHCEAIIATALAWKMTGDTRYAVWHEQVHKWAFKHFSDPLHGEWYGYLHRDGGVSQPAKGNLFKGPFHLPRMLWYCDRLFRDKHA